MTQSFWGDFTYRAKQHPSFNHSEASSTDEARGLQTRTAKVNVIFAYDFIKSFHVVVQL